MAEGSAQALAEHRSLLDRVGELLPQVDAVAERLIAAYGAGGRVFAFGNGGSAADAQHLAAELVGRFARERRPLPASALSVDPSVVTSLANDYSYEDVFARQVHALVSDRDVVVAFTTSGGASNVVNGLAAARERGATTVLFVGGAEDPPALRHADLALVVPSTTTARVQELHLLLMHLVVEQVDAWAAA